MDFRDVTTLLHGSAIDVTTMDFLGRRLVLRVEKHGAARAHELEFVDVELMRWKSPSAASSQGPLDTVGLEKLGAGEVWRLYAQTPQGAELEVSCGAIGCDGAEVTGIGRSYRH